MKPIAFINLAGLLALGVLSVTQWQANRQLNHEINRIEAIRIDQTNKLDTQFTHINQQQEDNAVLKQQILELTDALRTAEGSLKIAQAKSEQLENERNQLKENINGWAVAVEARDERIKDNQAQILELSRIQKEAVEYYNTLAKDYNESVKLLNERTAAYNALVERMNKLANNE